MFKEKLLLGQYYPGDSPVHRLDARAKISISLIYMISLFVADDWTGWGFMALICGAAIALSRIPLAALWRGLKLILFFAGLTLVLNMFIYPGEALWSWRSFSITREGLIYGFAMGLRLILLVLFASLLTLTTTPIQLTDGLESLLQPLSRIKVPAHEIAMMMSIALRFIPTVLEEFDRIILAQKARGADLSKGNLAKRAAQLAPLLVPLFVAAFRRAEDLAQAMEAKCYRGGEGRSRWKAAVWQRRDSMALGLFIAMALALIIERILV